MLAALTNTWNKLQALEAARGHPCILYYTVQGQMMEPDVGDSFDHVLDGIGHVTDLDFMIESLGGHTQTPSLIVALLRSYADRLSGITAGLAHSAATAALLGTDEIVMTIQAQLGPLDPTRRHPLLPVAPGSDKPVAVSVQDLRRSIEFIKREIGTDASPEVMANLITALFDKVHPMAIGAIEQSYELSRQVARNNLSTHMADADAIDELVNKLIDGYNAHTYPIMRVEARQLGLAVVDAEPWNSEIRELHAAARGLLSAEEVVTTPAPSAFGPVTRQRRALILGKHRAAVRYVDYAMPVGKPSGAQSDPWSAPPGWLQVQRSAP